MRVHLINPSNVLASVVRTGESRWNQYRVWQPLSLMVLAGLTPREWEVEITDENLGVPDYGAVKRPDLVGITAFTSQAQRAYQVAAYFRCRGVPVVMGGIHATMCTAEAERRVDAVVTGEAEGVWHTVLDDVRQGNLQPRYDGGLADPADLAPARHDLLPPRYAFGALQTTRGCPLSCSFCSVSSFNGHRYRQRPIEAVIREFRSIPEQRVLIVDDNLIGTRTGDILRAKELFGALASENLGKEWVAQTTLNFSEDEELMALAARAGCRGVFIGFESTSAEGLQELGKTYNLRKGRDFRASVRRIQRHRILVAGSFIIGLEVDERGIGRRIARQASEYGLDFLNAVYLTPLPGTRLWEQLEAQDRIVVTEFPEDWRYFTLTFPVANYRRLSTEDAVREMDACGRRFYSLPRILHRVLRNAWHRRGPLISLVGNLSYRNNVQLDSCACRAFQGRYGRRRPAPGAFSRCRA